MKSAHSVLLKCFSVASLAFVLSACESEEHGTQTTNCVLANYDVAGKVEKGAFVSGSSVNMQPYSNEMKLSGKSYNTSITDDEGTFVFETESMETPIAELTATGYYYNEVKGKLSEGTLTLKSLTNVNDKNTVNVNILTHLIYPRVKNLMNGGMTFSEANDKAYGELLTAFGLQQYVAQEPSQISVSSGTDAAGALIAVSSMILADRSDAEITEYLAKLSKDFGERGTFSDENKKQLRTDMAELSDDLNRIAERMKNRYADLGKSINVKDLKKYFDWNNDGVAGNDALIDGQTASADNDSIVVTADGGEFVVNITSPVKLTLDKDARYEGTDHKTESTTYISASSFESLYESGYQKSEMKCDCTFADNKLKLVIGSNPYKNTYTKDIIVYDFSGTQALKIRVVQNGNATGSVNLPKLGTEGNGIVNAIAKAMEAARELNIQMDCGYTGIADNGFKAPLSASNSTIRTAWEKYYTALQYLATLKSADASGLSAYQNFITVLSAIIYCDMTEMWGTVPYVVESSLEGIRYYSLDELRTLLVSGLNEALPMLEEKKNTPVASADDFLQVSKDVARITLARLYMNNNQFNLALPLLQKVIANGFYEPENTTTYSSTGKENIFGYSNSPQYTYADALLLLSECEYRTGATAAAKQHLQLVADAKSATISGSDIVSDIKSVRKNALGSYGGCFAFLKRNNLAQQDLGLQAYQLLFPIPSSEIGMNPKITQNPGY